MVCTEQKISCGKSAGQYYLQLTREDYYSNKGAPPGNWLGSGAKTLDLEGSICSGDQRLGRLMQGRHPHHPDKELRRGAAKVRTYADGRTSFPIAAYDLTFSAPKSVSVLYGLSEHGTRSKIAEAQRVAVNEVADYLEAHLCRTRTGRGGKRSEKLQTIFAAFNHITSRELDPQLHTHLLLMNTGLRRDGKGGAIDGRSLLRKETIFALGQLYRDRLANELEACMALQLTPQKIPDGTSFEIAGIPQQLCQQLSKRSAQIEAVASPEDSPKERKQKVLNTRAAKPKELSHRDLFRGWREETRALGYEPEQIVTQALKPRTPPWIGPRQRGASQSMERSSFGRIPPRLGTRNVQPVGGDQPGKRIPGRSPPLPEEVYSPHPPYDAKYWRAIDKARKLEAKKRSQRKRQELYLYLTGRISHRDFRQARNPEKYPKSKLRIHADYTLHQISKRQRDVQLYIHGHAPYHESVPRTLVGTHFAYLTNQISKSHYIRLRAEKEAWKRYRKKQKRNEYQPPERPPRSSPQKDEKTTMQSQQHPPPQQSQPPLQKHEQEQEQER